LAFRRKKRRWWNLIGLGEMTTESGGALSNQTGTTGEEEDTATETRGKCTTLIRRRRWREIGDNRKTNGEREGIVEEEEAKIIITDRSKRHFHKEDFLLPRFISLWK